MVSELYYSDNDYRNYLKHHGIPGMRWGVRRYQNADGSLTAAGRKHVGQSEAHAKQKKKGPTLRQKALRKMGEYYEDELDIVKNAQREKMGYQHNAQQVVNNAIATKKAKGFSGKLTEFAGSGAKRTSLNTEADYKEKLAKTYKNEKKRGELEREARNLKREAEYYDKKAKNYGAGGKKALKQAARDVLLGNYDKMKIPYETADGRVITRGRHKMEKAMSSAVVDVALYAAGKGLNKAFKTDAFSSKPIKSSKKSSSNNDLFTVDDMNRLYKKTRMA